MAPPTAATPVRIDTGAACNNRCAICPRPSVAATAPGDKAQEALDLAARFSAAMDSALGDESAAPGTARAPLIIHGGEPTLHPELDTWIARAREQGRPVVLETNARAFVVADRALRVVRAGARHAVVTLHGGNETSHDYLTRTPGSFRQTVAGSLRLRAAGLGLTLRLVVSRTSLGELPSMATTALGMGASSIRFSWARPYPSVSEAAIGAREFPTHFPAPAPREWLMPRYSLGIEALTTAANAVMKLGRPVTVDGMPACLAPTGTTSVPAGATCFLPGAGDEIYAAACDACSKKSSCPGVPKSYLDRFGADELRPQA